MTDNKAAKGGGVMAVSCGSVTITGPGSLCAERNTADRAGGFAFVLVGGQLLFSTDSQVNFGLKGPDTIALNPFGDFFSPSFVRCGTESNPLWTSPNSYTVRGLACACNDKFVANTSTACDGCNGKGWTPSICACISSALLAPAHHRLLPSFPCSVVWQRSS